MSLPYVIAKMYCLGLLPRRIAYSAFWRATSFTKAYVDEVIECGVQVANTRFVLALPLKFRQNWSILFSDFNSEADGFALSIFRRYAARSRVIFDIGMNAGLYLYHAIAARPPDAHVFGFEPNSQLAVSVERNIRSNNLERVQIINACVAAENGPATLFLTDSDHMSSLKPVFIKAHRRPLLGECAVQCVTLDSFVTEHQLRPDLLKIDVEGAEDQVIAGGAITLEMNRPVLLMEIAETNVKVDFVQQLFALRYRCFNLRQDQLLEIPNVEGLIAQRKAGCNDYLFTTSTPA